MENTEKSLIAALSQALEGQIKGNLDMDEIEALIDCKVAAALKTIKSPTMTVSFREAKAPVTLTKRPHMSFNDVLGILTATGRCWMAGPAGSGKTTIAEQCAESLGLKFYFNGALDSSYKLSGFIDANGRVVSTQFKQAYQNGGVYLFDECDASTSSALLAFNAALANGSCDFPDGRLPKHPDFFCLAAANTWGIGAGCNDYVGRNVLDAAFLDRFVQVGIGYDEDLERDMCSSIMGNDIWAMTVQAMRRRAKEHGMKVVISPRATIYGAQMLAQGISQRVVNEACIRKGMTEAQWDSINR